ncbi:hypothetical protein D3C73_1186350 [compost metagenome]
MDATVNLKKRDGKASFCHNLIVRRPATGVKTVLRGKDNVLHKKTELETRDDLRP